MSRIRDYSYIALNKLAILLIALMTASILLLGASLIGSIDTTPSDLRSSGEVTISEGSHYLDQTGHPTAVGEIENDIGEPITNVTITVEFYGNNETLSSVEEEPLVSTIPDGKTVPFEVKLDEERQVDSIEVDVSYEPASNFETELSVQQEEEIHRAQDSVTIAGSVENTGDRSVERPIAIVTFYDENGTVLGARVDRVSPSSLEPGEIGEFSVRYSTLGHVPSHARDYTDYTVVAVEDRNE